MSWKPRSGALLICALLFMTAPACGKKKEPPVPTPGTGAGQSITGRERIGWDQQAVDATELATFRYAIYVDGVRSELAEVSCVTLASAVVFSCSARLPAMSNGSHTLELAAFVDDGRLIEGSKSSPFVVIVTGASAGSSAIAAGDVVVTDDGVRLRVEVLADKLEKPSAVAVTAEGRVLVGSATGVLTIVQTDGTSVSAVTGGGAILAIAPSPTFDVDRVALLTEEVRDETGRAFRISRYREAGGRLGERMVVLQHAPTSAEPAAALRFGVDGKLYAAFDDGGSADAAARISNWSGKLLRMEPDGRTPDDQPSASPVLWHSLSSPRGFDWTRDGSTIWIADASTDGSERLRVMTTTSERPRRMGQRATFALPRGIGASAVAFYKAATVPQFSGDLFVAGRDAGYILRIRFDRADPARPASTERLLEGSAGAVRALEVGPDGAIYFCTETSLMRLVQVR